MRYFVTVLAEDAEKFNSFVNFKIYFYLDNQIFTHVRKNHAKLRAYKPEARYDLSISHL